MLRDTRGVLQVAFFAGSAMLMQFKDQIATVTKKDFVPYSERRAAELQLLQERMEVQDCSSSLWCYSLLPLPQM